MFSIFDSFKQSKNFHNKYSQCDDMELARIFREASGKEKLICAEIIQERLLKSQIQEKLLERDMERGEEESERIVEDHSILQEAFDEWKKENVFVGLSSSIINLGASVIDSMKEKAQQLADFRAECEEYDDMQLAEVFRRKSGIEKEVCVEVIKRRMEDGDFHPVLEDIVYDWKNRNG